MCGQATGVEFPPRTENTAAIFTPQTHPVPYQPATSIYENMALESSLQSDVSAFRLHAFDLSISYANNNNFICFNLYALL